MRKRSPLRNKEIILGVTGSVAAYKAVELVRRLKDEEAAVTVMMTAASLSFITPLSLELASGRKAITGLFDDPLAHVNIPGKADLFIMAPATANIIGKMAGGIADDALSSSWLAYTGKTIIAPAMNTRMYAHPALRKNLETLKSMGVIEIGPQAGVLACKEEGIGKLAQVQDIIEAARIALSEKDLSGKKVVVTAGPTREYIDPVRFISNPSSGKMGYALAKTAVRRGAEVVLVTGPSALDAPYGIKELVKVETTGQMRDAVMGHLASADILVMAAAPADFSPEMMREEKAEKSAICELKLKGTVDILAEAGRQSRRPFLAGFSAETGHMLERARRKMREKGADLMVFNDVSAPGAGFETETNRVVLIERDGNAEELPLMDKEDAAWAIFDKILALTRK